jgi:hypothetical protein
MSMLPPSSVWTEQYRHLRHCHPSTTLHSVTTQKNMTWSRTPVFHFSWIKCWLLVHIYSPVILCVTGCFDVSKFCFNCNLQVMFVTELVRYEILCISLECWWLCLWLHRRGNLHGWLYLETSILKIQEEDN